MIELYAENILIGSQWESNKTLMISNNGLLVSIVDGKSDQAQVLDGPVIPGMVNCHSHAFQRAFAGYSEYKSATEDSFWSWRDIMYRFVAKISPEDAYHIARFVYLEMLKAGYTSVAEFHYLHHQPNGTPFDDPAEMSHQVINAADSTGILLTHLPVLYTYSGFGQLPCSNLQKRFNHSSEEYMRLIEQLNKYYVQNKEKDQRLRLGFAPHSLRAVSDDQINDLFGFIRGIDAEAPIHIHIAEQLKEVEDCLSYYHKRPVQWLLDNLAMNNLPMDKHWCLVHATHLNQSEIKALAKTQAVVGICPTTEANLGDGIFPAFDYLQQGGRFAIGSDSHISVNVSDELKTLEYGQRLTRHQRAILVDREEKNGESISSVGQYLYCKAAKDGADAISQNVGALEINKRADLLVLDNNHPSLFSKVGSEILDSAIFACNQLPVADVFIGGKQVIHSGQHPLDENILQNYRAVLARIVTR